MKCSHQQKRGNLCFLTALILGSLVISLPGCHKSRTGKGGGIPFTVDIEAQPEFLSGRWHIEITDVTGQCSGDEEPFTLDDETLTATCIQNKEQVLIDNLFKEEASGIFDGQAITFQIDIESDGCTLTIEARFTVTDENHFSGTVTETETCTESTCVITYNVEAVRTGTFMTGQWELTITGAETCTGPDGATENNYENHTVVNITHEESDELIIEYVSGNEIPELTGTVAGDAILFYAAPFGEEPDIIATIASDRDSFLGTDSYTDNGEDWTCEGETTLSGTRMEPVVPAK